MVALIIQWAAVLKLPPTDYMLMGLSLTQNDLFYC